jgi:hypothetical protein
MSWLVSDGQVREKNMIRVVGLMMICASAAVQAQQAPQTTTASNVPQDNRQKVTCRVHMEGNMPKRVCMTNAEWAKLDSGGDNVNGIPSGFSASCNAGMTTSGAC